MKLITNIRDYYDGAFQYSEDVIYRRINEAKCLTRNEDITISKSTSKCHGGNIFIGFCGKIYPFYMCEGNLLFFQFAKDIEVAQKLYEANKDRRFGNWHTSEDCHHLMASADLCQPHSHRPDKLQIVEDDTIFFDHEVVSFVYYFDNEEYLGQYVSGKGTRILGTNHFHDYDKQPIPRVIEHGRSVDRGVFIKNPILRDFDFQRNVDSYTAAQEIEMYLGKLAINETPPMPVGSDEVIAASKGFDKWSFRKMPTKKKAR